MGSRRARGLGSRATHAPRSHRLAALLPVLVLVPVLLAYLGALAGTFQFDDFNVLIGRPAVQSLPGWWHEFPGGNRPLLKLSYALQSGSGDRALAFHAVNIAIHLVNVLLVQALAARVLGTAWAADARGPLTARTAAAVAALLFGLHPAHTEAVTYLSGRSSALVATFWLGAVLAYMAGRQGGRPALYAVASPLLFVLAMATKESAITLPLLLLLWETTLRPGGAGPVPRHAWVVYWLVLMGVGLALGMHPVYAGRLVPDLQPAVLLAHLLSQIDALTYLVSGFVFPWPLNIDPDLRPFAHWTPALALRGAVLTAAAALAGWALRRRPVLGFGLAWFIVALLPTNTLLPRLDLANDRQLYLAGIGPIIAIAAGWAFLWRAHARLAVAVAAAVLTLAALLTVLRHQDYRSEVRLWEQTAAVSPRKARVLNNLGVAYSTTGCPLQAEAAYREALRRDPAFSLARTNLQVLLERVGPQDAPPFEQTLGTCRPR